MSVAGTTGNDETEGTALAGLTLDPDTAAMKFDQLPAQVQAEATTFIAADQGGIELNKRLERQQYLHRYFQKQE